MSGLLLRSGRLRDYNALGSAGRQVHTAAPQLRALVKRLLGPQWADMLAIPQINEAGDTIGWYSPVDGMVVPWDAASEDERAPARQALQQARQEFQQRGAEMAQREGSNLDMEMFARLLPLVTQIPDESHIHLVDGRPVLTFWGFGRLNAPVSTDIIRDLAPRPPAVNVAPQPNIPAPALPIMAAAAPWWRRWWWWLALLLLLLLLLLFGLRSCHIALPVPGFDLQAPNGALPALEVPRDGTFAAPGIVVPGTIVPGAVAPGTVVPGTVVPGSGEAENLVPKSPPDGTTPEGPPPDLTANKPNQPPKDDSKVPPPAPDQAAANDAAAKAGDVTPAPPQLTLPDKALKDDSTAFLDGHWRSRTSLMDSQTGRPLEMEYEFKDGKGTATIQRSDGTKCQAPVQAVMQDGKLILDQSADARCPDGQVFGRSKVECRQGSSGKAECQGHNADGGGYSVQIVK